MQLYLSFLDIPVPESHIWERLSEQQKAIVIETISRILTKAATTTNTQEQENA